MISKLNLVGLTMVPLKIATYNMHGLRQGSWQLQDLCKVYDVIYIQEHWLAPFNLHDVQDMCPDMLCLMSSAMTDVISKGVLKGRPFGGVGILLNNKVATVAKLKFATERYIIVQLHDLVFINVYLPCTSVENWQDELLCCLAAICNDLTTMKYKYLIFGGDLNVDFNLTHGMSDCLNEFFRELDIVPVYTKISSDLKVSFYVESTGACSLVDHFIVSRSLADNVDHYAILDSGTNFSDHCPVIMHVNISDSLPVYTANKCSSSRTSVTYMLRWDKANVDLYYHTSMELLNDIKIPWHLLTDDSFNKQDVLYFIDSFYTDIVTALQTSSDSTVPKYKSDFYKYWWDQELDLLKQESVKNHRIWTALGRPRYGNCFEEMRKSKLRYKQAIRKKEKDGTQHFSDSLADALLHKDMNSFWKSWRSKMGGGRTSDIIDEYRHPRDIADRFADIFKSACLPNSNARHEELKRDFLLAFEQYFCPISPDFVINVEFVSSLVCKLKLGKAAGFDGLTAEHITHAHPILIVLLSLLFQMLVLHGIVPSAFGQGIVIPLVKNTNGNIADSSNYRGITLSPVISKIFELLMMDMVKDKLISSDLQFGFKPNSSCSHAILALQAGVKHICDSGGTATLCALDISKAFDRVNFYGLFKILIDCLFPKSFIDLLLDWFSKCISCVRWNGILSSPFVLYAGVRQGGLLSPALFAMYIDKLIQLLKSSGFGCRYNGTYIGCLCYADDIILISHSVTVMQNMLDLCDVFSADLDVRFNTMKSVAMRIGSRYDAVCADLTLSGGIIQYVQSLKYLGVSIKANRTFICNFDHVKAKFYRTFNCIYAKSFAGNSELITLELLRSCCLPILLYVSESLVFRACDINSLNNCINTAVAKIFRVSFGDNLDFIRQMTGLTNLRILISERRSRFLSKVHQSPLFRPLMPLFYDRMF